MNNLKTLVLMQLKDKVDFSYLHSVKKTIFKVVTSIIKFAVITAVIWLGFFLITHLRLVSAYSGIPQDFLTVIFTIVYSLSIITCSFGLMKTLYEGKDNQLLLTFPASRTIVFASKLIVYYIYELIRNITYLLPIFVAYGIINNLPLYFYLWLIVIYFVVVAVPVALGALLSIPTMYVVNFIRQHKWLEYIILVSSVVFIIWGLLKIIDAIPENIDIIGTWGTTFWEIRAFLGKFIENFAVFYLVIQSITGLRNGITTVLFTSTSMMTSFVMLLVVAGVVAITFVIVRPLYFHMASSPFEYKKVKVNHEIKNKFHNPVFSSIKKDMILSYRTQSKFYSLLGIVVGLPIAILLLNKLYAAMDTRLSGTNMTIAFNMLMILLIVLSSNINLAHIYSEEGASTYLLKVNPKPYIQTLFVKLMPNLIGITVSIIGAVSVMCTYLGYGFGKSLLIFGIIESFYVAHLLMSAEMDIMNPQSNQYQTAGTHPNNPNDIKSTIYAFGLSAGIGLLTYFLISESRITIWWKLLGLGLAFLALRIWLYINKIKVYFKEKQG